MPAIFEHPHTVLDSEIDELGHANNLWYVAWMQSAAVAHSAAVGWPTERYQAQRVGWVARSHGIDYLHPAQAGDALVIYTWVSSMSRVQSLRNYHIVRRSDERLLARAHTNWAFIDLTTGRPTRIPPDVAECFEIVAGRELP